MPTRQEVIQDPKFKDYSKEEQIYRLGKADAKFGTYTPEEQNYILDGFLGGKHEPAPLEIPPVPEKKSFLGEFTDKFQPTAVLKNLPEIAGNAIHEMNPMEHPENYLAPGIAQVVKAGAPMIENIINQGRDTIKDLSSPMEGYDKLLSAAKNSIKAVPVLSESMAAGERMIPPSGDLNWNASGSMVGDLANAALPLGVEAATAKLGPIVGPMLKNSGARNIENIFKAGTDKSGYANVEDLSKKIMGGKYDVLAPSDKALMNKLDIQKTARLAPNKAIEAELAETPIGPKGKLTALDPINNFIKEQGENPTFANKERVSAGQDARGQLNSLFEEQQKASGNALEFDENGNPVSQRPTIISKNPKFKDILETKQSASETADKHDYFDRSGPGFDEAKAAKGQAAGKVAQGTRQALEESVAEHAQTIEMPQGFKEVTGRRGETTGIVGPKGEKLGFQVKPDSINWVSVGKGQAATSQETVQAMKSYGQSKGLPVYMDASKVTPSGQAFIDKAIARGELILEGKKLRLVGTGNSAPSSDWLQYGERNSEAADLIDMKKMLGRQKTIGTMGLPKYVLQRMGSAFGLRAAGAEEASRLAGSTAYQSGMAYSKKTLADMLMGQGMSENAANAAALKIISANSSR